MKRSISILLCITLILSSSCFAFADFGTTDSNNLSSIKTYVQYLYNNAASAQQVSNIVSYLSSIVTHTFNTANRMSTVVTNTQNTANKLIDINDNLLILMSWLDPDNNGGSMQQILQNIYQELIYQVDQSTVGHYIADISSALTSTNTTLSNWNTNFVYTLNQWANANRNLRTVTWDSDFNYTLGFTQGNVWGHIVGGFNTVISNLAQSVRLSHALSGVMRSGTLFSGYNSSEISYDFASTDDLLYKSFRIITQSLGRLTSYYYTTQQPTNWLTLQSGSFTPTSVTNGLYGWLSNIQTPVARLAYVYANDDEIAAREAAAANQEAVVDNFIDSSGGGSASPSDISSVSDLSAGFKDNITTDADPSDLWTIFDSSHYSWFSQETADQLDTTSNNRKSKSEFDTPLLDENINEIYNILGVKHD